MNEIINFIIYESHNFVVTYGITIVGSLALLLIGEVLTIGRDNRDRNKTAIADFRKIMSSEREKLEKNSVMDIVRQENAYSTLYSQLFIIQKIRIQRCWSNYTKTEREQKKAIQYHVLYHNKPDVLRSLTKLVDFN